MICPFTDRGCPFVDTSGMDKSISCIECKYYKKKKSKPKPEINADDLNKFMMGL